MNKIRKNTSIILTFIAIVFLSLALAFSNGGTNGVKASSSDNPEGFTLESGTEIASSSEYLGIRWETKVSKAYYEGLKDSYPDAYITFGTWVAPASSVNSIGEINENLSNALNIEVDSEAIKQSLDGFSLDSDVVSYYSIIDYDSLATELKLDAYKFPIMARSYVKIELNDGSVEYNYSGAETVQSARLVATMAIISGQTTSSSDNYEGVLEFIGGVEPIKDETVISYNILRSNEAQSFAFPGLAGKTIDEIAFNSTKIDYEIDGENLIIKTDISTSVNSEKNYVIVYTNEGVIYREVKLINVIKTPEDFIKAFSLARGKLTTATTIDELAVFDGEYYLANNIDFTGYELSENFTYTVGNASAPTKDIKEEMLKVGLTGTFDGNGYTIYNLEAPQGGIFGAVSGTIKNVAFVNISSKSVANGVISHYMTNEAVLENVYVKSNKYDGTNAVKSGALLAKWAAYGVLLKGCYFEINLHLYNGTLSNTGTSTKVAFNSGTNTLDSYAIVVSEQIISQYNNLWNQSNRYDANKDYSNVESFKDGSDDLTVNKNTSEEVKLYRYDNVTKLMESYTKFSDLLGNFNSDYFEVGQNGKVAWVKDYLSYTLIAEGASIINNEVQLSTSGPQSVSLSVKNGADEIVTEGISYSVPEENGVVKLVEGYILERVGEGDTTLTVKIDDIVLFNLTVQVSMPIIQKQLTIEVEQDSAEGSENGVLTQDELGLIFGEDSKEIDSVKSLEENFIVSLDKNVQNRLEFKNEDGTTFVATGKSYKVVIYNDTYGVELSVMPITKIIRQASDLAVFTTISAEDQAEASGTARSDLEKVKTFSGYYVLGNDINAEGINKDTASTTGSMHSRLVYGNAGAPLKEDEEIGKTAMGKGLTGTFDGRGYSISNLVTVRGGLFGFVNGTIKNVAFKNIKQQYEENTTTATYSYMLGIKAFSTAKIENVYFEHSGASSDKASLFGSISRTATIKNLYYKSNGALFALASRNASSETTTGSYNIYAKADAYNNFENVIIVSPTRLGGNDTYRRNHVTKDANDKFGMTGTTYKLSNETIKHFKDVDDMTTMYQVQYPYINTEVWNTEVTTSAKSVIDTFENDYFNVVVTKSGETITNVAIEWANKNSVQN